ncbi:hypothetical protein MOC70_17940 [Bacillus vallismortis]|uniref:hypothetical protein n=1 Tax=Bacillus vallismortis TaxID=72361 RepID=UPI0022827C93|nr:hypothetical protein [Bacillus vallismortis]MCY8426468.1 hypothetical protein [Bacillus vallismortis]
MEDLFFQWISPDLSTFSQTVVTPFLNHDWEGKCHLGDLQDDEFTDAYQACKAFLMRNDLYDHSLSFAENSRGYRIDHTDDFETLGKMAARNDHYYLFFADRDKVFMFTDALTLQMYCKDEDVLDHEKKMEQSC